ncbi:PREDICTED: RNA polymerase II transcription factor B subunit 2 isoform X2 [Papilio polytes]|uniref:RNA polymerase II transcription factor B subunit 2 isoform X2 n=1 Tax=Papilio polytes TaxID=76194 RepID=UPI0006763F68|nr:PREDICTED: RNA polymerase II transcription factor B subunit 2 isoform X2 [Papilio polytes]
MSESSKSKSLNLNPSPTLQCKNLHEYLQSRTPQFLETLYNYPTICLAVYRELPELARHFVIRLLFVEQPVPQAVVASWVSQTHAKEQSKACEALSELSVWQEAPIPGGLPGWILAQSFKKNLKAALLGGGRPWSMSSSLEPDSKARDVAFLDSYALERWECVLHYMVGSTQTEGISADAVRILLHAGLMTRDAEDGSAVITRAGFQFLLLSTAKQVWLFLQHYLHTAEKRSLSAAECLAFLYQLSFSTLGKDYSTEGMSNNMLVFLQHLREFGLVYQRKRKAGRFYPTRLALNITCVRGGRARLHRGGDELPRVRVHADQPAGGAARPLHGAALQVPEPGGGRGDARVGAAGAARRHHRRPDHTLPAAARAPPDAAGALRPLSPPNAAAAHRRGPGAPLAGGEEPLLLHRGRRLQPVPLAGGLRAGAGVRARAERARVAQRAHAHRHRHPRRPRRRAQVLEEALQDRLAPRTHSDRLF